MPIPTQAEHEEHKKETQEKIRRLNEAYDSFVVGLDELEKEQNSLVSQLKKYMDKTKIHDILSKIHSIKD
jgi:hypothetical protein